MRKYAAADWARLGQAVYEARKEAGLGKTAEWAEKVGRSSRTLLGLERGEVTGTPTLEDVEDALAWPRGGAYRVLGGLAWRELVGGTMHDLPGYVSAPGDRVEGGASDSEVLRAIAAMRDDMQAMEQRLSQRLDRLEDEGS